MNLLLPSPRRGALLFTAASTDKITVRRPWNGGSGASMTYWQWFYRTSDTNGQGTGIAAFHDFLVCDFIGADDFFASIARTGVNASSSSDAGAWPQNVWTFAASTYDESDGIRLFIGTLTSVVSEVTYRSRTVGTGTTQDSSAADLLVNNRSATLTLAMGGSLASAGLITRRLSLQELVNLQYRVGAVRGQRVLFDARYSNGLTIPDLSGNGLHGRITGAVSTAPPLGRTTTVRRQIVMRDQISSLVSPYTRSLRPLTDGANTGWVASDAGTLAHAMNIRGDSVRGQATTNGSSATVGLG